MAEVVLVAATESLTEIAVRGRLDARGVGEADVRLTSLAVPRRKPALIDLTEVTFIGSLGIAMLMAVAKALRNHQAGMAIVVGAGPAKRVLEVSSIHSIIPVVTTREDGLRALQLG